MKGPTGMMYSLDGMGTSTLSVKATPAVASLTEAEVAEEVQQALATLPPFPFERPTGTAEEALEYYRVSTACRMLSGHTHWAYTGRWAPVEFDKGIFFAPEEHIRHPITVGQSPGGLYAIHVAPHLELCGYTWP